jgi:MFS family permease
MTYLASISLIQSVTLMTSSSRGHNDGEEDESNSTYERVNTLISILILVKLLPNVFFMPLGGILADKFDRRNVQIVIDCTSSLLVFVYLLAVHLKSIPILYLANCLQESLGGIYIPSNSAILPMLANSSDSELQKATTLSGLTWSLMAAVGSSTGGLLVAIFGVKGCFIIDSITYIGSAALLTYGVRGTFVPTEEEIHKKRRSSSIRSTTTTVLPVNGILESVDTITTFEATAHDPRPSLNDIHEEPLQNSRNDTDRGDGAEQPQPEQQQKSELAMFVHGLRFSFIEQPLVGAFALLKGSAAIAYGATDVLNVSFSARGSESDPQLTSLKLGSLFGCVGVGCILGSMLSDQLATLSQPKRLVQLCLMGYGLISFGCLGMGLFPDSFGGICLSGVIRSAGSSLIWIDSTLLLQKYSPDPVLGRVRSIDFAAALFGEAFSALGGGLLMDDFGVAPEQLSLLLAVIALGFAVIWSPLVLKIPEKEKNKDDEEQQQQ